MTVCMACIEVSEGLAPPGEKDAGPHVLERDNPEPPTAEAVCETCRDLKLIPLLAAGEVDGFMGEYVRCPDCAEPESDAVATTPEEA